MFCENHSIWRCIFNEFVREFSSIFYSSCHLDVILSSLFKTKFYGYESILKIVWIELFTELFPEKRPSGNEQKELSLLLYHGKLNLKYGLHGLELEKWIKLQEIQTCLVLTQDYLSGKVYLLVGQYFLPDFTTEQKNSILYKFFCSNQLADFLHFLKNLATN